jgi:hypothetical protein
MSLQSIVASATVDDDMKTTWRMRSFDEMDRPGH